MEKRATKDEMFGWHHGFIGHEIVQASGDSEGQRNLACCSPWDHRVGNDLPTEPKIAFLSLPDKASLEAEAP